MFPRTLTRFPSPLIRSSLISRFAFTSAVVTRRTPRTQRLVVRSPFALPAGTPVDDSEFEFPPVVSSLQHLSASSCLGHFFDVRLYFVMQVSDSNDPHDTYKGVLRHRSFRVMHLFSFLVHLPPMHSVDNGNHASNVYLPPSPPPYPHLLLSAGSPGFIPPTTRPPRPPRTPPAAATASSTAAAAAHGMCEGWLIFSLLVFCLGLAVNMCLLLFCLFL